MQLTELHSDSCIFTLFVEVQKVGNHCRVNMLEHCYIILLYYNITLCIVLYW